MKTQYVNVIGIRCCHVVGRRGKNNQSDHFLETLYSIESVSDNIGFVAVSEANNCCILTYKIGPNYKHNIKD